MTLLCYTLVDRKILSMRYFIAKWIYSGKRKGCDPVHADMASPVHTLACVPNGGVFIEGKMEVRTIELYYRVLPVGFSQSHRV